MQTFCVVCIENFVRAYRTAQRQAGRKNETLPKQPRDCEDQASGARADDRAIHPDILEVAPDHQLETIRKGARVPAAHDLGDERADLTAPHNEGLGQVFHSFVDVPLHDFIGRERLSDNRDWFLEREAQAR